MQDQHDRGPDGKWTEGEIKGNRLIWNNGDVEEVQRRLYFVTEIALGNAPRRNAPYPMVCSAPEIDVLGSLLDGP